MVENQYFWSKNMSTPPPRSKTNTWWPVGSGFVPRFRHLEQTLTCYRKLTTTKTGSSQQEPFVLANSGHLQQARKMSQRPVDLAQRERAAIYKVGEAVWEAVLGNASAASPSAMAALELFKGPGCGSMALPLHGLSQAILPSARTRERSWKGAFRRIRQSN